MRLDDWHKIDAILHEVFDLETEEERREYVKAIKPEKIRIEIESILDLESNANDFLSESIAEFMPELFEFDSGAYFKDQMIGNYRVISEIGRGGMGAVYLAERADGEFEQRVALKMLRRELNTAEIRARFRREREILAALEHPNMARLIDAGTTSDGVPYLAMEYVEGNPITEFCSRENLNLRERLELFRRVCSIVSYAHQNLIIHRDLKPSNILVTNEGIPKLLDFGISKLINDTENGALTITKFGAMTPEYASPEQIRGDSVSTTTDVYSLGVILYELLTATRPFCTKNPQTNHKVKDRLKTEPLKPSIAITEAISKSKDTSKSKIVSSGLSLPFSSASLRGDIDNIILKALKTEASMRYTSVEKFSEDIGRFLSDLPVLARPDKFSYLAAKFIVRHKFGVFAALMIFLSLSIGLATTYWQAVRAEKRFNEVRMLANSLLFEISPEIENVQGTTKARRILVGRSLEYLDGLSKESSNDPSLQRELAAAYEKVGDVQGNPYQPNLGNMKGALESYKKARTILETLYANAQNDEKLRSELAENYKLSGDVLWWESDTAEAKEFYMRSLQLRKLILDNNPNEGQAEFEYASALLTMGSIPFWNGDNKAALKYFKDAHDILEKLYKRDPEDPKIGNQTASSYRLIAEVLSWDDKAPEANNYFRKALEILIPFAQKYPNDRKINQNLFQTHLKLGENMVWDGDQKEGFEHLAEATSIAQRNVNKDRYDIQAKRNLAAAYNKTGDGFDLQKKGRKAIENYERALLILRDIISIDNTRDATEIDIGNTYMRIGDANSTLKNYESAIEKYKKALEIYRQKFLVDPENIKAYRGIGSIQ
ncbi:MAG: serine/threonine protein kinase, partial [Acidobacteria bacterium]|nr:serine/threonine protein kinase [Acidobacteriota bacterium]